MDIKYFIVWISHCSLQKWNLAGAEVLWLLSNTLIFHQSQHYNSVSKHTEYNVKSRPPRQHHLSELIDLVAVLETWRHLINAATSSLAFLLFWVLVGSSEKHSACSSPITSPVSGAGNAPWLDTHGNKSCGSNMQVVLSKVGNTFKHITWLCSHTLGLEQLPL